MGVGLVRVSWPTSPSNISPVSFSTFLSLTSNPEEDLLGSFLIFDQLNHKLGIHFDNFFIQSCMKRKGIIVLPFFLFSFFI